MAHRKPKRQPARVVFYPWDASWAKLFSLAGDDWQPPERVRISHGARSLSAQARFLTLAGEARTCTARFRLRPDGKFDVTGEQLSMNWTFQVGGR